VTPTDSDLVARARRGNQEACREIVRRYERPIFNMIVRMVRDRALAEDLSQDTFLKAFSRLDRYDPAYRLSNWLFKIAHNTVIDHVRKQKSAALSPDSLSRGEDLSALEPGDPAARDPIETLAQAELARAVDCAMASLRPEYRQVVVLRYQEELSHEEIARIMGLPVGTVKSHLHRARAQLAVALARLRPAEAGMAAERTGGRAPATGSASGS
jgi:RNA polymerase sigma-70 factor, ECF subfamily